LFTLTRKAVAERIPLEYITCDESFVSGPARNESLVAGNQINGQHLASRIIAKPILDGLHHEYRSEPVA
jgi:hypothetical protein